MCLHSTNLVTVQTPIQPQNINCPQLHKTTKSKLLLSSLFLLLFSKYLLPPILLRHYFWCFSVFHLYLSHIQTHAQLYHPLFDIMSTMVVLPLSYDSFSGPTCVAWFWWCPWLFLICNIPCIFSFPVYHKLFLILFFV